VASTGTNLPLPLFFPSTINPLKPENKEQKTDKTRKVGGRERYKSDGIWLNTKACAVFTTLGFHG
jgi:hypothetical protein